MPNAVFYDNDYRRMGSKSIDYGKALPIPPGAMFVCYWLTVEPDTAWMAEPTKWEGKDVSINYVPPEPTTGNVDRDDNTNRK